MNFRLPCHRIALAIVIMLAVLPVGTAMAAENDPLTGAFDPTDLMATLAEAAGSGDRITYLGCIADTFVYVPLPSDVVNNRDIDWSDWGRARELAFVNQAFDFGDMDFPRILEVHSRTGRSPDEAEWDVTYAIGEGYRARGVFGMVRSGQRWYLWRWEDIGQVFDADGQGYRGSAEWRATIIR